MSKFAVTLFLLGFCSYLLPQEKWAVAVGISDYPRLAQKFPKIVHARQDAEDVIAALAGPYSQFSRERMLLLSGENATSHALREVFFQRLSRTDPEDLVVFFFAGHGYLDPLFKRFYLLLSDTDLSLLDTTAISLDQLAYFFQSYVPARNIMICLDARRSPPALGESWQANREWAFAMKGRRFLILEASAPSELSREGKSRGFFADFFLKALCAADDNGDGLITVSEFATEVCRMRFSGISQHPAHWGSLDTVLSSLTVEPHIQLTVPEVIRAGESEEQHLAGYIRSRIPIRKVLIARRQARIGPIQEEQMHEYRLIPWQYTYFFSVRLPIASGTQSVAAEIAADGSTFHSAIHLKWSYPGWHGQWMPPGMSKGSRDGLYLWEYDQSEMVYVPQGTSIVGIPAGHTVEVLSKLAQLRAYLQEQSEYLQSDRALREVFIAGLEESNATLLGVSRKLKIIYDQVELFQKVNTQVATGRESENPSSPAPPDSPSVLLQEHLFIALSEKMILNCYQGLRALLLMQKELLETIDYLDNLLQLGNQLEVKWVGKTAHCPEFYLDRYELTNLQYRKFCDATYRPYPPAPWWDEDYFFDSPDYPVVNVSWEDAMAYAMWAGKTLPTSTQWERSARGESGQIYPWGNEDPNQRLTNADVPPDLAGQPALSSPILKPVCANDTRYPASPCGCYHLAGNVEEWCRDIPDYFIPGKSRLNYKIAKGGDFASSSVMLCSWFRNAFSISTRRCTLGFRCALSPGATSE